MQCEQQSKDADGEEQMEVVQAKDKPQCKIAI
jgi:hypothetical protein